MADLGVNYKDAGRLKEAIPLLEEAYESAKRFPGNRWVGVQLLEAYAKAGEEPPSLPSWPGALPEVAKRCPRTAPMLVQIGMSFLQQKKWIEAEPLLRESLAIREKGQPDVWSTFNTQSLLGGALLGEKKYAEAEPLLLGGYEGMKRR